MDIFSGATIRPIRISKTLSAFHKPTVYMNVLVDHLIKLPAGGQTSVSLGPDSVFLNDDGYHGHD